MISGVNPCPQKTKICPSSLPWANLPPPPSSFLARGYSKNQKLYHHLYDLLYTITTVFARKYAKIIIIKFSSNSHFCLHTEIYYVMNKKGIIKQIFFFSTIPFLSTNSDVAETGGAKNIVSICDVRIRLGTRHRKEKSLLRLS